MIEKAFPVAAVVLLLSGGYLVNELGWHWSDGWVSWSARACRCLRPCGLRPGTPCRGCRCRASRSRRT
jgi:hypothetical protein